MDFVHLTRAKTDHAWCKLEWGFGCPNGELTRCRTSGLRTRRSRWGWVALPVAIRFFGFVAWAVRPLVVIILSHSARPSCTLGPLSSVFSHSFSPRLLSLCVLHLVSFVFGGVHD